MSVKITCDLCGKHILRRPCEIKKFKHFFCSRKCHNKWQKLHPLHIGDKSPVYNSITYNCRYCNKEFKRRASDTDAAFCSIKCFGLWKSENMVGEKNPNWNNGSKLVIRICKNCDKEFKTYPVEVRKGGGIFCSNKCKGEWKSKNQTGINNPAWNGGTSFEPYCHRFNNKLKERIRNRDNRICQLCGCSENGKKHAVHHIHYDKENCYPDLITLCNSCNSKVNGNRDHYEIFFMNMLNDKAQLMWKY